ncbi:MAG: flagellar basal body-associated protein FliL [Comamonadaceae bacterium]
MATTATPSKTAQKTTAKNPQPAGTEGEAPSPKKSKLLLIILALVLLLAGGGGAAWYFLRGHDAAESKPGAEHAPAAKAASSKPPVFVTLEPFTVNLQHEDTSAQYLQVGLSLKMVDAAQVDAIKSHMPEIRSRVLMLLSSKKASEISSSEGKKTLMTELTHEITLPLGPNVQAGILEEVLFTSFVIQ